MQTIERGENVWGNIGTGLGELAGAKLAKLVGEKKKEIERSNFTKTWEPILGKQSAHFLSNLDPQLRQSAMQNIGSLMQLNEPESSAEQVSGMRSLQQPQQEQQQGMQQYDRGYFLKKMLGSPEYQQDSLLSGLQGGQPQQMPMQQNFEAPQQQMAPSKQQKMTPEKARLIADLVSTPQERQARQKLELEKSKLKSKEDLAAWKNTQKYREKILDDEQSSREALQYIKEAQRLEKEGDFPSQAFASFLKGAEWEDVPGFLSGNAEAFNKVLANFQRGVKDVYGGNVSNMEMEQFLKTIPTIYHTPEGRALIFAGMKKYYRAGKERAKIERQIIKNNDGVPPQDLHEEVNEKFRPIQKELSRSFKRDVESAEKLASKTSRLGSVAAYGAGKVAGAIPGILKAGAKGAIGAGLGGLIGGPAGALTGAGIGSGAVSSVLKSLLGG